MPATSPKTASFCVGCETTVSRSYGRVMNIACSQPSAGPRGREPELAHRPLAEGRVHLLAQLGAEHLELLGPHRRAARHRHDALALGDRLRLGAHDVSDGLGPAGLHP